MGILPSLFLIFLVLKLIDVIAWSWWWVFSPLLVMAAFCAALFTFMGVIAVCCDRR
jgi:hypothetical protein